MSESEPNNTRRFPQFSVWNLLVITTACCLVLAAGQFAGINAAFVSLWFLFTFAPLVSFVIACLLNKSSKATRVWVAGAISLVVFLALVAVGLFFQGRQSVVPILLGTGCLWGTQWIGISILFSTWKAGLRSAQVPRDDD